MQRSFATKAGLCLLALAFASVANAQPFGYAINSDGYEVPEDQIDNLYRINLATGEAVRLGATSFLDIEGLSFSPQGDLYGADDESNSLLRLDIHNGSASAIGGLPGNLRLPPSQVLDFGLSFTCDALYASSDNLSTLYRIDQDSGEAFLVGATGVPLTGLASFQNTLYGIGDGGSSPALYRVDPATADTTLIGFLGAGVAPYTDAGLDFDAEGRLWAITDRLNVNDTSNPSQILLIDVATGSATVMAETLYGIEGLAISPPGGCDTNGGNGGGPAPIPTLSTMALLLTASILLLFGVFSLRRRDI